MLLPALFGFIALIGFALWIRASQQLASSRERARRLPELESALKTKEEELTRLRMRQVAAEEKLLFAEKSQERLTESFKALSSDALEKNNRSFLDLAKTTLEKFQESAKGDLEKRQHSIEQLVTPVKESLQKLDLGMRQIEKDRKGEQESLKEQMRSLLETEKELRSETASLVKALRAPLTRGRWGEIQLRRVVELAGMIKHCDFSEQTYEKGSDSAMRPDMIVRLPGERQVVIDAKAPLEAYLEAMEAKEEATRDLKLKDHARQVRNHLLALGKKAYWESFQPTPEFVVLFLPSETFFNAALEQDPTLIEIGVEQGVIVATPTTLIALLRAIAYGWKQESLSRHAQLVSDLGHDLYKRIVDMSEHWAKMGRALSTSVDSYNRAVGSLESRVLPTARKFRELGAASSHMELEVLEAVERLPRTLQAPEFTETPK